MSRFIIAETNEATLSGENHNNNLFLHCAVNEDVKFTPSVYKRFYRLFLLVLKGLKEEGIDEVFSFVTTESEKINKWQSMFGMEPLLETESHILYRRKI